MSLPTLLDDMAMIVRNSSLGWNRNHQYARNRIEAALRLLDQPGAQKWLEALAPLHQCDDFDCPEGDCDCEVKAQADASLIATLRNALADAGRGG